MDNSNTPSNRSADIQSYETKVTAKEITTFLQENAGAIDNSVKGVIQKNFSFLEKYVTKRGLVKLVDEIKTKQIRNVAQFYELIYKIETPSVQNFLLNALNKKLEKLVQNG